MYRDNSKMSFKIEFLYVTVSVKINMVINK